MSRLAVALVVCLVLTAGCSGLSGEEGPPDREPYGVDEEVDASVETAASEDLLPGLTTDGLTNASRLRETHSDTIDNRTYTIEYEYVYVIEEGNETFQRTSESEIAIDPEAEVVREIGHRRIEGDVSDVPTVDEPNVSVDRWFGDRRIGRTEFGNGSVAYSPPRGPAGTGRERIGRAERSLFSPLQAGGRLTTAGAVNAEDGTYYVVNGSENVSGEGAEYGQESREVDVRALVREDGLVRQTVAEQETVMDDGERIRIVQTTEITAVGETDVGRPDWYDDAIEARSEEPDGSDGNRSTGPAGNESAAEGDPSAGPGADEGSDE